MWAIVTRASAEAMDFSQSLADLPQSALQLLSGFAAIGKDMPSLSHAGVPDQLFEMQENTFAACLVILPCLAGISGLGWRWAVKLMFDA